LRADYAARDNVLRVRVCRGSIPVVGLKTWETWKEYLAISEGCLVFLLPGVKLFVIIAQGVGVVRDIDERLPYGMIASWIEFTLGV